MRFEVSGNLSDTDGNEIVTFEYSGDLTAIMEEGIGLAKQIRRLFKALDEDEEDEPSGGIGLGDIFAAMMSSRPRRPESPKDPDDLVRQAWEHHQLCPDESHRKELQEQFGEAWEELGLTVFGIPAEIYWDGYRKVFGEEEQEDSDVTLDPKDGDVSDQDT